jgi:FkbM family methyltransferase
MVSARIANVRRGYQRGELTAVGRRWAARRVWPGVLPEPEKPKPELPPPLAAVVDYDVAMAWFEKRRKKYVRLTKVIEPYLDTDGVMFDIGANVGFFTKVVGELTGYTGTVHLFEPLPHLASLCRRTAGELPFWAQVHEFGLGDEDALLDLYVDTKYGNLGWNTLEAKRASAVMARTQIRVHRFETCGLLVEPSFVKIDVEGAEYRVLEGMLSSIKNWTTKPPFLIEVGWGQSHPEWTRDLAALNGLVDLGYRTTAHDGSPLELANLTKTTDVLFLPT